MRPANESKSERFCRVAEARVNKIISMIRLLGNCSGTGVYSYDNAQVEKIFTTLQTELERAKLRFLDPKRSKTKRFSLKKNCGDLSPVESTLYPEFSIALPDGTFLRAVGHEQYDYPCINIYWDNGVNLPSYPICFAEFNPEKPGKQKVCIGVYCMEEEDIKYYEPYITEERNQWNDE